MEPPRNKGLLDWVATQECTEKIQMPCLFLYCLYLTLLPLISTILILRSKQTRLTLVAAIIAHIRKLPTMSRPHKILCSGPSMDLDPMMSSLYGYPWRHERKECNEVEIASVYLVTWPLILDTLYGCWLIRSAPCNLVPGFCRRFPVVSWMI